MEKRITTNIHYTPKVKVHFIGIGGSGISAVSLLSQKMGYKVSGCDLEEKTAYLPIVKKYIKKVFVGHDEVHLEGVDIVVVSPAVMYQNKNHAELIRAKRQKEMITWQEFLGRYLHQGKKIICVSGTHGKSTTSAMASSLLEDAGRDPSAVIGASVNKWNSNFRFGKGVYFVTEADEFYDNFLNFHPEIIILNNIEFDHPDYFNSQEALFESFTKFIRNLKGVRILIVNQESDGVKELFVRLGKKDLKNIKTYGYFIKSPLFSVDVETKATIRKKNKKGTTFFAKSKDLGLRDEFNITLPGQHNVANALGPIILGRVLGINKKVIYKSLFSFSGIGRRLQLIGENKGIRVYDDYAHHPTAIKATLSALRQFYPQNRIWAVVEPHSYSRTKALLKSYNGVFSEADKVIIGPIFKARDKQKFGVDSRSIVDVSGHRNARSLESMDRLIKLLKKEVKPKDIVLVMGAGKSYDWSRKILNSL